jgi:hypothetical protein
LGLDLITAVQKFWSFVLLMPEQTEELAPAMPRHRLRSFGSVTP